MPWGWQVEVLLDLPVDRAAYRVPSVLAELDEEAGRTRLRMRVDSLDWMAGVLAGLGCDFTIRSPEELRASVACPRRARCGQTAASANAAMLG